MRKEPQFFIFTYHKVGTILMSKLLRDVTHRLGMSLGIVSGFAPDLKLDADIVIFVHSLIGFDLADCNCRGVRLFRDPRDLWVSGYLYHRRCREHWCTNTCFDTSPPITFPRVPKSQQHRPEVWKRNYLDSLGGKSYQQNLLELGRSEGLAFELDRYAGWTIESMCAWRPNPSILDLRMEWLSTRYDSLMNTLFHQMGLRGERHATAMGIATQHDIARMSDAEIAADDHIYSRTLSKWRGFLQANDLALYDSRFAGASARFEYADQRLEATIGL
ncbi:MAG: hypothetical protein RLO48_07310 [Bauldia litoralis]